MQQKTDASFQRRLWLKGSLSALLSCVVVCLSFPAAAFENCINLDTGAELRYQKRGIEITNAGNIEIATRMKISVSNKQTAFFPYAAKVGQDRFIIFPLRFLTAACQIIISEQLPRTSDIEASRQQAILEAAECLNRGETPNECLTILGRELAKKLASSFAALPEKEQQQLFESYGEVIDFILAHELAHHLLGHFEQPSPSRDESIKRERAADHAALIMQGQAFRFSLPTIHLFGPLAQVEGQRKVTQSSGYESAICRKLSAAKFALALGNENIRASEAEIMAKLKEIGVLKPAYADCGDGELGLLVEARRELRNIYARFIPDMRKLQPQAFDATIARMAFIEGLKQLRNAKFAHVIAGAEIREIAKNWLESERRVADLVPLLDTALVDQEATARMRNADYSNLLQYRARAIEALVPNTRSEENLKNMRELLVKATTHSPYDTNTWIWLAVTSRKQGDCESALRFSELAMKTADPKLNDPETMSSLALYVATLRPLAADRTKCASRGKFAN